MNVQRQFQNSAARWDKFDEFTGLVMANLSDVSSRISSSDNHSKVEKIEKLEHLKTCAYELRRIDAESKARSEALKDLSQRLHREQSRGEPIEDFTGIYQAGANKARQAANDQSLKKDDDVLAVDKLIKALTSDGDEQEEVIEAVGATQAVTRCPILNCDLVKPVKNSTCGHVYSLKGAISLLFQNNAARSHHIPTTLDQVPPNFTARCPGFGCNSSLSPATLRRDYSTELTQRQNQSASMRRDSLDIDVDVEVL